jgi:hypothetical protein
MGSSVTKAAMLAAALFGLLLTTEVASAQGGSRPSSIQRRVDVLNRQGEQYERDNPERDLKNDPRSNDRRRSQAVMAEVKKDLESLQAGYNQIVLAMAANKSIRDPQILQAVVEIKHSSTRLKHNLALPQSKDDKNKAPGTTAGAPESQAPVMALRKHIYSFVMNPLFESPAVLDLEQARSASRDLDRIIEISDSIVKSHGEKKSSN